MPEFYIESKEIAAEQKAMFLDNIADSIFIHDEKGTFLYINEAAYKSRGYSKEELLRMNLKDLDVPEFAKNIGHRMEELLKNGAVIFESAHFKKDKTVIPIEVNAKLFEIGGKKYILSLTRDITERKKAENEINNLKSFYELILNNIRTGIIVTNREDVITYANNGLVEGDGTAKQVLLGKNLIGGFELRTTKFLEPLYLKAKSELKPIKFDVIPVVTPSGKQGYFSGYYIPQIKDNKFEGMIITLDNTTLEKIAKNQLEEHAEEMEKLNNILVGREMKMIELKKELENIKKVK